MRLALRVGHQRAAARLAEDLRKRYTFVEDKPDVVIVIGGDGFMLHQLRRQITAQEPLAHYGLNVGTSGFLLNRADPDHLIERITAAQAFELPILQIDVGNQEKESDRQYAINEVTLLRQSPQTAHLKISIDGIVRMRSLVADGLVVSSPAGSTGYNSSLHGPILPLKSSLLTLTPISPFRPRRWRGALLPQTASVRVRVNHPQKRPVGLTVDNQWVGDVVDVKISVEDRQCVKLLFDPQAHLQNRIIKEQFST